MIGIETALGDVVDVVMGQAPSSKDCNFNARGTPFVKVGEFGESRPVIREWTTNPLRIARRSDVLLCVVGATCGKINLGEDCAIGRSVAAIRPVPTKLDQSYLYYFMMTLIERLRAASLGAAQTVISKDVIEAIKIPLAPMPEQRRMVGILDEAFEGVATAKANAEKNLKNARALFEIELNAVFTRRGEGWLEKRLGEIADFKNGLNYNQSSNGQTVRIVGVGDFGRNYLVPVEELQSVTIDGDLDVSYELRKGDIVTVRSNGSKDLVGRCMLVPHVDERISYSGFVIRIRPNSKIVYPRLLLHFMKSSATRRQLTGGGQGANISNINQGKLSTLPLSLPPRDRQQRVADELDELMDETQRLESVYQRKAEALEELKKSLLHEAFLGNL